MQVLCFAINQYCSVIESRTEETDPKKPNVYRYCLLSCVLQV